MKSCSINKILKNEIDPAFRRRAKIIFENLDIDNANKKILEIGCGRGFYLKSISENFNFKELVGIDLNKKYLKKAKKNLKKTKVKLINGDATKLPFPNNYFDVIIATEILEHIPDDKKAIKEMYRVLKKSGIAMISVPNKNYPFLWDPLNWILEKFFKTHISSKIWWLAGIWADHVRLYSMNELVEKFKKSGFKIKQKWIATHYCLPFSHFLLYGIGKNLVEMGFFPSMYRFGNKNDKKSILKKAVLLPINKIDSINNHSKKYESSVNLIIKIKK